MRRFPFHTILFGLYPALALLGANILEVQMAVVIRPLLLCMAGAVTLLGLLRWVTRDWLKAGLLATFMLLLFFSYGHVYEWLQTHPLAGVSLGRHRYLAPLFAILAGVGIWIITRIRDRQPLTVILNLASIGLFIFPIYQLVMFGSASRPQAEADLTPPDTQPLNPRESQTLPDVYYIVLDTYMRSDAMMDRFGYDNQPFVDSLRSQGFYVADCARSNYSYTLASMTTATNMTYLPTLEDTLAASGKSTEDIWILLKHSRVRQSLEALGYRTVAFQTTFAWSELTDADIYLGPEQQSMAIQSITPFEGMLLDTTAASIVTDAITLRQAAQNKLEFSKYSYHIETIRYTLKELPAVATIPGQKFVFVHLLIPHLPYIFKADGSLQTDPGYFSNKSHPVNETYEREGYIAEVAYLNRELSAAMQGILAESKTPPIIVIHGDHGLDGDNKLKIFEAVYMQDGYDQLYPSITPVNLFRVIFDQYFGTTYGKLDDTSYLRVNDAFEVVPETSPDCSQ